MKLGLLRDQGRKPSEHHSSDRDGNALGFTPPTIVVPKRVLGGTLILLSTVLGAFKALFILVMT